LSIKSLPQEGLESRDWIARLLGVAPSTVTKQVVDGLLPVEVEGGPGKQALFKPSAVVAARIAQLVARYDGAGLNPQAERAARDHAQAALARQLFQRRSSEVVLTADVHATWSNAVLVARSQLLRLPTATAAALAHATTAAECQQLLEAEVRRTLEELARNGVAAFPEPPAADTPTPPPAAPPRRKRRT
jgi:hypothetical protein